MQSTAKKAALPAITLAALGVVFGDIGTSPLYALRQCFLTAHLAISEASVLGILSLIRFVGCRNDTLPITRTATSGFTAWV